MDIQQIKEIVDNRLIPDTCKNITYHERKYYWLIEGDNYVYKIYKPIKSVNIDYSTPEKRCNEINKELMLNKTLAGKIYSKIIGVKQMNNDQKNDETSDGKIIDYALVIKKINPEHSLQNIINSNGLTLKHIDSIAARIAHFHSEARIIKNVFGITAFQEDLELILRFEENIKIKYGEDNLNMIKEFLNYSNKYLNRNRNFFNDRTILGYIKDLHGAILPENIHFKGEDLYVTGRISLNDSLRYVDVLNEVALLGMELDSFGQERLSLALFEKYILYSQLKNNNKSKELYQYYKIYHALKSITKNLERDNYIERYISLLKEYEPEKV